MGNTRKTKTQKSKGLGDTVEKIIKATGLDYFVKGSDCGCDKRKEALNKLWSYRIKARCFTEEEYKDYKHFVETRNATRLEAKEVDFIVNLYASVFNRPAYRPCSGCSPKPFKAMIDKLDDVYKTYDIKGLNE